jgi:hypothetical protein
MFILFIPPFLIPCFFFQFLHFLLLSLSASHFFNFVFLHSSPCYFSIYFLSLSEVFTWPPFSFVHTQKNCLSLSPTVFSSATVYPICLYNYVTSYFHFSRSLIPFHRFYSSLLFLPHRFIMPFSLYVFLSLFSLLCIPLLTFPSPSEMPSLLTC